MKKLELKHWSAYLPYDIEVADEGNNECNKLSYYNYNFLKTDRLSELKPLLYSLTYLSSEFSLHASNIITIHEEKHITTSKHVIQHQLLTLINKYLPIEYRISRTHYWVIEYLLENHFDIFGLIENGLAIDKTKL